MAIKIYIDQGHNPNNPNAGAEAFGVREQDITYEVGILLADLLRRSGNYDVRLARSTPEASIGSSNSESLRFRVNDANAWGADYYISIHANTRLGMLLGFGLTMYITLQALINVAVISGCIPTKGMPAPFISYGGSNMLTCMTAVGLLLSIAQETVTPDYNKHILAYLRRKWPFSKTDEENRE